MPAQRDAPAVPETNTKFVVALAAGAAVGGLLFGFDTSILNGAINGVREALRMRAGMVGFVTAISLVGCAVGAWFAGPASARLGRSRIMFFAGVLILVGSLATALLNAALLLGLSRFTTGLGIGAASAVVPAYIAEISPTSIRGRLGSLWQFAIVIGQFLGLLLGHRLTLRAGSEADPL